MPLYPYRCTQCSHRFEKIQRFSDEPEKVCPKCGGALERPLTAPGLQFKGSGWYVNDYAAKSSAPAESGSGEKETKKETKTDSSGDKAAAAASAPPAAPASPAKSETTTS